MTKILGIVIALALLCGIGACASPGAWDIPRYLGSIQVLAAEGNTTTGRKDS